MQISDVCDLDRKIFILIIHVYHVERLASEGAIK